MAFQWDSKQKFIGSQNLYSKSCCNTQKTKWYGHDMNFEASKIKVYQLMQSLPEQLSFHHALPNASDYLSPELQSLQLAIVEHLGT
jgi:hypothetical protein